MISSPTALVAPSFCLLTYDVRLTEKLTTKNFSKFQAMGDSNLQQLPFLWVSAPYYAPGPEALPTPRLPGNCPVRRAGSRLYGACPPLGDACYMPKEASRVARRCERGVSVQRVRRVCSLSAGRWEMKACASSGSPHGEKER